MAVVLDDVLSEAVVEAFDADGAVVLRQAFAREWIERLDRGVARNEAEPGPLAEDSAAGSDSGRFFNDYCNWRRIPEYRDFVEHSPAAAIAAGVMQSRTAQLFHEHLLIKEPGTAMRTPWHHDLPYYNVQGMQTVSIWLALDVVPRDCSPEFVAGSHRWGRLFYPRRFRNSANYPYLGAGFEPVPDIDAERDRYRILAWHLEPGDAVLFNFLTLHAAPGNNAPTRRRGFSTRWLGDDARYATRPGPTSPPYDDIGLAPGDRLPTDLFPVLWPRS